MMLAAREFDVTFGRWGPLFEASAREPTQVARELLVLSARMFSPVARLESGDAKEVRALVKGGSLPTLDPQAVDPKARYKPSFQFVPNGTLFRPMRPILEEGEIVALEPISWTFYEVTRREGPMASCQIFSAWRNPLPPVSRDSAGVQLIVARSAGGATQIRLVDREDRTPLAAMDASHA